MFFNRLRHVVVGAGLLLLSACGGSLSTEDSQKAYAAVSAASAAAAVAASEAELNGKAGFTVDKSNGTVAVKGTLTSPSGGTVTIDSSTTAGASGSSQTLVLDFSNWKEPAANLTLKGKLTNAVKVDNTGASTTTTKGDIELSGALSGTASFNITTTGMAGCVTTTGTIAGNAINIKAGC